MPNALARSTRVEVTSDLTLTGGWLQLNGVDDFNDEITPNLEDSGAYDTNGWSSREVTMQDAKLSASFFRRYGVGVIYDPGQEIVRATRGQFGDAARCGVRWFDKLGGPEAARGIFIPTWKKSQTGKENLLKISADFDLSDGQVETISNPISGVTLPVISKAAPAGQTAGNQIALTGGGFTGATQVSIGGTVVTIASGKATVLADGALVFVVPAGAAGSAPITVTNAAGVSAAFAYTRGA